MITVKNTTESHTYPKIVVMNAHLEGKQIEQTVRDYGEWENCPPIPSWDWDSFIYRIKRKNWASARPGDLVTMKNGLFRRGCKKPTDREFVIYAIHDNEVELILEPGDFVLNDRFRGMKCRTTIHVMKPHLEFV